MNKPPLLYFVPKYGGSKPPKFLADRFTKAVNKSESTAHGPNNMRGTLFSPFADTIPILSNTQRWSGFKHVDDDGTEHGYWIGVEKSATPELFEREKTLPGTPVELSHGEWIIPTANPFAATCVLPYFDITDGKDWHKQYKDDYIECSEVATELAGKMREILLSGDANGSIEFSQEQFRHYITTIIGVNYDLTQNEMSALQLFDQEKYFSLMCVFVDFHEIQHMIHQEMEEANSTLNPSEAPQDGNDIVSGGADS